MTWSGRVGTIAIEEQVIDGDARFRLSSQLRELWDFRTTLWAFTERHIRVKYKQTLLGVGWAVIQPLTFVGIVAFTLGRTGKFASGNVPYAAAALSALVPWMYMQGAIALAAMALITDAGLVRRAFFPREIPVISTVIASGTDLVIGFVLFFILGPVLGARVSAFWLLGIVLAIPTVLLTSGISLILAALNVHYRDFRHALPFLLQVWLFASPVAYPLTVVAKHWRTLYVALNPAAGLLEAFRRTLALGTAPDMGALGISLIETAAIAWLAYLLFKRRERTFAEVL